METKISIIIPIYKIPEKYLRKCITSVINQTLKEIEIILIDDDSPDNCGEICDEYKKIDNRIHVVHNKQNVGVAVSRNIGIETAKSEWISFVDSDDWIEPDMYEQLYFYTKEEQDCDIIMGACFANYENSEIKNSFYDKQGILTNEDKEEFLLQIIGSGNNKKYPKEVGVSVPWGKLYKKKYLIEKNITFVPRND